MTEGEIGFLLLLIILPWVGYLFGYDAGYGKGLSRGREWGADE